jgi:hypothetical protein
LIDTNDDVIANESKSRYHSTDEFPVLESHNH